MSLFFVFLSFYILVFLHFCLFVFLLGHHSDQMFEGSQVSKVTLCVQILKCGSQTRVGVELPGQLKTQIPTSVLVFLSGLNPIGPVTISQQILFDL